jgi:hypothetical protein
MLNGDVSDCVGQLITNHVISPTDADRVIDYVAYTPNTLGITLTSQVSYKNLLDVIEVILDAADVGIKTVFDPETCILTITLYEGTQTQAVFAREYENVISENYISSITDYAETALIGGEGEGVARTFATIIGQTGENRREIFVDADDLRSEDFPDDYQDALIYRGQAKLAEHAAVNAFDAEVNTRGNLVYKTDYDLGQIVTIHARRWGVTLTARITEVTESYDENGLSLDIVFGRGLLTLAQKIKEYNNE